MADTPRPEDASRELLEFLDEIDQEVQSYRQSSGFEANSGLWARYRRGDSWGNKAEEPIFLANLVGNLLERKIAVLTESQPDIRVSARNPNYASSSNVLTEVCAAILAENGFDARVDVGADLGGTFGHCGFNTAWDPFADFGNGDIITKVLDPRRFAIDHHCVDVTEIDRKAQYMRIDNPLPLSVIKETWPDTGKDVVPDTDITQYPTSFRSSSWFGGPTKRPIQQANYVEGPYEWAVVKEYWIRSDVRSKGQLLFPTGRVIHRAGDVILDDGPNPYWDGMWPVDVWDWRVNPDAITGRSDIADSTKLQEAFNRVGNAITKNIILNAVVTIIGDYNALTNEDWKKLDNRAARILRKSPGRTLEVVPPPPIPDQYLRFMELTSRLMETLFGVPAALQGRRQEGVIASSAVEGLMTMAETLIKATARRLEYTLERIGQKMISRVIQFYTSDRVMLTLGPTKEWSEYTFRRAELLQPLFGIDPATGQPIPPDEDFEGKLREFFTQFRFKVTPLSSLPHNKVQRGLMAMSLFQAGLIDEEEVLRHVNWPNWKEILPRIQQAKSAQQEQAMSMMLMGLDPSKMSGGGGGSVTRSNARGTQIKSK